jgi:cystathionine beta-lyase
MINQDATPVFVSSDKLRSGLGAKWARFPSDVLAAWIGDSDLAPPGIVLDRVARTAKSGVLHHVSKSLIADYLTVAANRLTCRFGVDTTGDALRIFGTPMQAMAASLISSTEVGDAVVVITPIYPPILATIRRLDRVVIECPMEQRTGHYALPIAALRDLVDRSVRAIVLANPSNPTGHVATGEEVEALLAVASDAEATIISDEVFADAVYPPARHVSFVTSAFHTASRAVAIFSPNKAFSLSGCGSAVALRKPSVDMGEAPDLPSALFPPPPRLGLDAGIAAWSECDLWLDEALRLLQAARDAAIREFQAVGVELPMVSAGFFLWFHVGDSLAEAGIVRRFLHEARVAITAGGPFGRGFDEFGRLNFATSTETSAEIARRVAACLVSRDR